MAIPQKGNQKILGSFKIWGIDEIMDSERLINFLVSRHKLSIDKAKECVTTASNKGSSLFDQRSPVIKQVKVFRLY